MSDLISDGTRDSLAKSHPGQRCPSPVEIVFDAPVQVRIRAKPSAYDEWLAMALGERDFGEGRSDFLCELTGAHGTVRLGFQRHELDGELP